MLIQTAIVSNFSQNGNFTIAMLAGAEWKRNLGRESEKK